MKKIIFCDIPMKSNLKAMVYKGTDNVNSCYDKPVIYPINAVLADTIKKNDEIKVILLRTENPTENNQKNSDSFIQELNSINSDIGAKITYEILDSEFRETKDNHELRLKQMIDKIEEGSELFADITFGPKPLPMILMCVLSFAEKFLKCDVKSVVYGKVNFTGENISNPELCDVTSLYYMNNLTNSMVAKDSIEARKTLDEFFSL
ncbi:MAG: hypothetical protein J6I73_02845 [Treponema sp.]|nr:hypothetical protein [Treponema sp.]